MNYEVQGIFNLPISDTVAVRASVSYEDRGGVVDATNLIVLENGIPARAEPANPDSPAVTTTAADVDSAEVLFGRFSLLWTPSDDSEVNFSFLHQDEQWDHSTTSYIGADTALGGGVDAYQDSPKFLDVVDRQVDLISLDVEHDFGFASFTSATSYSVDDSTPDRDTSDFYETPGPTYYLGYPRINALDESAVEGKVFTQEFRLVSSGDNKVDWVVGAYYQKEEVAQDNRNAILGFGEWADDPNSSGSQIIAYYYGAYGLTTVGDFIEFGLGGIRPSTNGDESFTANYSSEFTDLAAFGDVTWHATDQWQMTVGGRFFKQDLDADLLQRLPYCGAGCSDDGADPNGSTRAASTSKFDDQIFKFNTSYDFNDDLKAYLTVSEGFRRGGANALPQVGPFFDPGFALDYTPDTLLNTEVGLKGSLLEDRLTYSAAIYQIDWDDVQIETFNAAGFRGVVNGGEAQTKGIELEATAALSDNFTATVGLSFVDAEITQDVVVADRSIAGLPNDVVRAGDPLPYVPEKQASIALNYNRPLNSGLVLDLNLDGNYRSKFSSQVNDTLFFDNYVAFDGYSQWNTTVSLSGDKWRATLWARNLTDESGLSSAIVRNANVSPAAEFGRRGFVSRPRTTGIRFTYFFD
jgi:iron complex outermembrane recepter protein